MNEHTNTRRLVLANTILLGLVLAMLLVLAGGDAIAGAAKVTKHVFNTETIND